MWQLWNKQFGSREKQKYFIYLQWNSINGRSTILILHWVDFYSVNKEKFSKTQLRTMNWNWVISNVLQMYCQYLFCDQNICINGMNKRYYLRESMLYLHEDFANILSYSSFMVPYVILSDIEGWITTRIYAIIKSELTLNKSSTSINTIIV